MDMEKVINCLTDLENIMIVRQEICPREELQYWIELQEGLAEAITLLKGQEAVEPTWQQGKAYCGACGKRIPLKIKSKFCNKCGKPILWEGRRWMGVSILEIPTDSEKERIANDPEDRKTGSLL